MAKPRKAAGGMIIKRPGSRASGAIGDNGASTGVKQRPRRIVAKIRCGDTGDIHMFNVTDILLTAGVKFSVYASYPAGNIYLTDANQLIGSYKNLQAFRQSASNYTGWHVHHIVEDDDLHRLGVTTHIPAYPDQLCVLIPERAHVGRINSILRRENPTRYQATGRDLRRAYAEAYSLIGDYCGGGEAKIRQELLAIVNAEFQKLGVP
jgi:hypothetical protein